MRVSSVTFGFTKNMGNYQSARMEATVEINEDDDVADAVVLAQAIVKDSLDMPTDERDDRLLREYVL